MRKNFLEMSKDLDSILTQGKIEVVKLCKMGCNHNELDIIIYEGLNKIKECIWGMIHSYDENEDIEFKYNSEYNNLIARWNNFANGSISPHDTGYKLEKVKVANETLMAALTRDSSDNFF